MQKFNVRLSYTVPVERFADMEVTAETEAEAENLARQISIITQDPGEQRNDIQAKVIEVIGQ